MNKIENIPIAVSGTNLYPRKDFPIPDLQDSTFTKQYIPYGHAMRSNISYSFIVEWQLPVSETQNAEKPNSLKSELIFSF
jgi:hypothetical protein